jgi:hypothetical protein
VSTHRGYSEYSQYRLGAVPGGRLATPCGNKCAQSGPTVYDRVPFGSTIHNGAPLCFKAASAARRLNLKRSIIIVAAIIVRLLRATFVRFVLV